MAAGLAIPVGLGLAGAAINGISNLFGKKKGGKYSFNPLDLSNINLQLQQLGALPPSPYRDAAIQQLTSSIQPLQQQSQEAYAGITPALNNYTQTANGLVGKLGNVSDQFLSLGSKGANPYLTYYSNPGQTEGRLSDIQQKSVDAAFNENGTVGGEALQRMGQVMSQNARNGVLNSGNNRRQLEAERMRLMQAKNQASADGQKFVQGTMQNVFSNYNQGLGQQGQFLTGASNASAQAGQIANQIPQNQMQAATLFGNDYRNTLGLQSSMETQARNEQIQREQQNNAIANQQAMAKFNQQGSQAVSNWQGQNTLQQNTPTFGESLLSGFTSGLSGGLPLGQLAGNSSSSGGSSGSGGFLGMFGGGGNNNNSSSNNSGSNGMTYNSYGGGQGYYGY